MSERFTINIVSEDRPGVLHRISSVLTRRRVNIASLTVASIQDKGLSRFSIVVFLDKAAVEKLAAQLRRIVEVREVSFADDTSLVFREIALFRVDVGSDLDRERVAELAASKDAKVVNDDPDAIVVEMTGEESEIDEFINNFRGFRIRDFVRSGRVALP